jgi:hypothetical protein
MIADTPIILLFLFCFYIRQLYFKVSCEALVDELLFDQGKIIIIGIYIIPIILIYSIHWESFLNFKIDNRKYFSFNTGIKRSILGSGCTIKMIK